MKTEFKDLGYGREVLDGKGNQSVEILLLSKGEYNEIHIDHIFTEDYIASSLRGKSESVIDSAKTEFYELYLTNILQKLITELYFHNTIYQVRHNKITPWGLNKMFHIIGFRGKKSEAKQIALDIRKEVEELKSTVVAKFL